MIIIINVSGSLAGNRYIRSAHQHRSTARIGGSYRSGREERRHHRHKVLRRHLRTGYERSQGYTELLRRCRGH